MTALFRNLLAVLLINLCGVAALAAKRVITLAEEQEPPQLNSTLTTDLPSGRILGHTIKGLMDYDVRGKLVGAVAEKWELTEKHAKFWLRKDAKWSDGKPVTAHDFVFAWQTASDPKTASTYAFILYPIKNAEAINAGKMPVSAMGVKALDDYTLHVDLEKPTAYFLGLTAFVTYLPIREDFYKAQAGKYGADAQNLLANGLFRLTKWVHGAALKLEKNPGYWDAKNVAIDEIDIAYITPDNHTRYKLFNDGKIDFTELDMDTIKTATSDGHQLRKFAEGTMFYLMPNHRQERPTSNVNLRKAIQLACDNQELVDKVLAIPGFKAGVSLFPEFLPGTQSTFRKEHPASAWKFDPVKAKQLFGLAKKELGKDVTSLHLLHDDRPVTVKHAEYLQSQLKRVLGLDLKIDKQIFKQRLAKSRAGDFDIVIGSWAADYNDPMTYADLFASWNGNNHGRYNGTEYDRLIEVAQKSNDQKVRMPAIAGVQKIINEDVVIIPQYERGRVYLLNPKIKGFVRQQIGVDPYYGYARLSE